jgi:hypothetical protein
LTNLDDESPVWYAVYGSNLDRNRFKCYLAGKAPSLGARTPKKCPAGTKIAGDRKLVLNFELYFAREAQSWSDQGVAFVRNQSSASARTLGRRYLLTLAQFRHVAQEENGGYKTKPVHITKEMLSGPPVPIRSDGWYRVLLPCGVDGMTPIATLTGAPEEAGPPVQPSDAYRCVIRNGLHQKYRNMLDSEIDDYLEAAIRRRAI